MPVIFGSSTTQDRTTTHLKFDPIGVRTQDFADHDSTFHVTEMPVLTTRPSVTQSYTSELLDTSQFLILRGFGDAWCIYVLKLAQTSSTTHDQTTQSVNSLTSLLTNVQNQQTQVDESSTSTGTDATQALADVNIQRTDIIAVGSVTTDHEAMQTQAAELQTEASELKEEVGLVTDFYIYSITYSVSFCVISIKCSMIPSQWQIRSNKTASNLCI